MSKEERMVARQQLEEALKELMPILSSFMNLKKSMEIFFVNTITAGAS